MAEVTGTKEQDGLIVRLSEEDLNVIQGNGAVVFGFLLDGEETTLVIEHTCATAYMQ